MTKETLSYVTEKVNDLIAAPSCCAEAKAAAQSWLEAVGTDKEADASKALIAEIEEDSLIAFSGPEAGIKIFGAERAAAINAHGKEIKAKGAKYCDCPACTAVAAILEKKDEILA